MFFNRHGGFVRLCTVCLLIASPVAAQGTTRPPISSSLLRVLSASVEELTRRVSTSVVQVLVTGYGLVDET